MADDGLIAHCQSRMGEVLSGKWRLDALIGIGGMAAVYAATHRNNSMAAIKILHPEVAQNKDIRERFLREAYIANKVGHAGTVKVLDDDVDDNGAPYLVMELLQGNSVEAWAVGQGGTLTIAQALDIIDQTLAILEAAHSHGIVHRDLKPENLFLVDNHKVVKMLDFGIARLRQNSTKQTQTGMVMGTPAFMAPEQALGRWDEVDARTDLWAVGATLFTLLTGRSVHEAETPGEMLVKAASHEARSLARVMPAAPIALVRVVDRALAYRSDKRFPDAASFRAEIVTLKQTLDEAVLDKKTSGPTPSKHETAVDVQAQAEEDAEDEQKAETYDPSTATEEDQAGLAKAFDMLENSLIARKQYGVNHPETKRRHAESFRELYRTLAGCEQTLAWNVSPYAFFIEDNVIWEPQAPLNRIPYQLFSDGVRTMGFAKGLDEIEYAEWIRLVTLDAASDMAPEDDLVTMLWDANFEHAYHQAIDTFSEGDQKEREAFEAERKEVLDMARAHGAGDISDAWQGGRGRDGTAQDRSSEILQHLTGDQALTKEAIAQAQNLDLTGQDAQSSLAARALMVDESTRALLAARLDIDVSATSERFVVAAAHAFHAAAQTGRTAAVSGPLRGAVDGLSRRAPDKAMDMILTLRDAVAGNWEGSGIETIITSDVTSPDTMRAIITGAPAPNEEDKQAKQERADYMDSMQALLNVVEGEHVDVALECLPEADTEELRKMLLTFVQAKGAGHEQAIGALFASPKVTIELGLDLVRLLAALNTPEAKNAISQATRSPHALVRIEALGYSEGVSSDKLRIELRKLLEDNDEEVRLAALRAMETYNITVAGPFVVLRIQDKAFLKLPYEERKQALRTVCTLRPKRAEELCMELLSQTSLIRSKSLEETRELAAQYLGEIATTQPAFYLLDEISQSSKWKANEQVRLAATQALARIAQRAERAKAAAARTTMTGEARKNTSTATRPSQTGTGATQGPAQTRASQTQTGANPTQGPTQTPRKS